MRSPPGRDGVGAVPRSGMRCHHRESYGHIPNQPEFAACRRKPTVLPGNRLGALSSRPRPSKTFLVSGATAPETKNVPAIRAGPPAPNRAIRARMAVRADAAGHVSTSSHGTRRIRGLFWNAYRRPAMVPTRADPGFCRTARPCRDCHEDFWTYEEICSLSR